MQKQFILEGLDCPNCAMKVERGVAKLSGVKEASVDFTHKKLFVDYEGDMSDRIKATIIALEPNIHVVEKQGKSNHEHTHKHHQHSHAHCDCHEHDSCSLQETLIKQPLANAQRLYIKGLDCASCAAKIEQYVQNMENVKQASLNFSNGVLYVELKETQLSEKTLKEIVQVIPTLEDGVEVAMEHEEKSDSSQAGLFSVKKNWRLYVGIVLFLTALCLEDTVYGIWLFAAAYLLVGMRVLLAALKNIMRGEVFDENFLMGIATLGAFAIASYEEAVAVMIFYEIGEMFQAYAVERSRASISDLMDIRADHANKLVDGEEITVSPEAVHQGDIIVLKPGERVPLDGIVIAGSGSLDTSALTGESMPSDVKEGQEILAGSLNLNSVLQLRVTKEYGQSTVARILELVENAGSRKAPTERFITKFARIYTPVVVGLAALLVVLPMLLVPNAELSDWLYRALTFLVVSCPCALVISIPLGLFAGIGAASRHGILIKGGNILEALKDIDSVVFDKTGTLTKGSFQVEKIVALQGDEPEVLRLAAYAESYSTHPIAVSICKAYDHEIDKSKLSGYEEIAGKGIAVNYEKKAILAGNAGLMQSYGIVFEDTASEASVVHIAYDGKYMGYVLIADQIKETSEQAMADLKKLGITKTVMLSGDRKEAGEAVGKELGLDQVYTQLLPQDKVDKVEELLAQQAADKKLAFVGDGINDAPVLARADIGVAMGGVGSDAAIEAADIVLMKDDPSALADAIRIAKKTMNILKQNIIFSLVVKISVLILAVFNMTNMWVGVFADVGVTLLAVINSMRALRMKLR